MKIARIFAFGLGAVVAVLVVLIALAFTSGIQTWAARKALASQGNIQGSIGSISAGLRHVEARAVKIESEGVIFSLPALDAELPLIAAGLREEVQIKRLEAKGWTLDLRKAKSLALPNGEVVGNTSARPTVPSSDQSTALVDAVAASLAPAFKDVFSLIRLPVDLALDNVTLEGDVLLPENSGYGASSLKVSMVGGGLASGKTGTFVINLSGATEDGGRLNVEGNLIAAMDSPRTFSRIGVKADAMAKGPKFPEGATLKFDATALRNPTGESYSVLISGPAKQLAEVKARLVSATSRISGTWKVDIRDTDLVPLLLGRVLPTFSATGEGKFETGTALKEVHGSGRLDASASRLEVFRPELAAVGAIKIAADFDVLQHGDSLRVERFDATATGQAPVLTVKALQPFEFNLASGELHVADPGQDLLAIALTGLPLAWARPFTGEMEITGGNVTGDFAASAREGGLALRERTPLIIAGVSLKSGGVPILEAVDLTLNASADYSPLGWQAQIVELTFRSKGRMLLTLNAKAGRLSGDAAAVKATGTWSADLPGWTLQPFAAGNVALASGLAQGDFSANIDGNTALQAKVAVTNLVASSRETLPAVHGELRADVSPTGMITFHLPLLFEQAGRKSDLLVAGTLANRPDGQTLDARISGDKIVVEDVQLLGLLVSSKATPAPDRSPAPDTEPFWGKLDGQLTLALKKLVYGGTFEVSDVGGTIRLDQTALQLENVRALFGPDSDLKLVGGIKFDGKAQQPYALAADLAVTNFDTKPAFQALDPAKLPTLEARVNLNGRLAGNGVNLAELTEKSQGDVQVTAKSGLFRALSADLTDKVQKTQTTVAALGGLLGAVTGKKEYADYANKTQILTEIAKALSEIPFDQLNVTASRASDLNMVLKDFTLISPEVRLTGSGLIRYAEGVSLLAQPLALQLGLGARGQLADLLKRAGLLEAKADTLGYAAFSVPINVSGTLAKTDTTELRNALLNSALERSGILDGILGK